MARDDDFRGFMPVSSQPLDAYHDFQPASGVPLEESVVPPLRAGVAAPPTESAPPQAIAVPASDPGHARSSGPPAPEAWKGWDAVAGDVDFRKQPVAQQQQAKEDYFKRKVAPVVSVPVPTGLADFGIHLEPYVDTARDEKAEAAGARRGALEQAHDDFMAHQPERSGWIEYAMNDLPKDFGDLLPKLQGSAKVAGDWFGNSPGGNVQARLVRQYLDDPGRMSAETRAAVAPWAEAYQRRQKADATDLAPLREILRQEAQRRALETPGQRLLSGTLDSAPDMATAAVGQAVGVPAPVTFSALQGLRTFGDAKAGGMKDEDALAHAGIAAGTNALIFPLAEATGGAAGQLTSKLTGDALLRVATDKFATATGERVGDYVRQGTTMATLGAASGGVEEAYDQYRAGKIDYAALASRVGGELAQGFASGLVLAGGAHAGSATRSGARSAIDTAAARSAWNEMTGGSKAPPSAAQGAEQGVPAPVAGGAVAASQGDGPTQQPKDKSQGMAGSAPAADTMPSVPVGAAIWANRDADRPVTVVDEPAQPGSDGRWYQKVRHGQGESYVPADELRPHPSAHEQAGMPDVREPAADDAVTGLRAPHAEPPPAAVHGEAPAGYPAVSDEEHRLGAAAADVPVDTLDRDALAAVTHLVSNDPAAAMRLHAQHPEDEAAFVAAVKEQVHGNRQAGEADAVPQGSAGDRGAAREDGGTSQHAEPGRAAAEVGQPLGKAMADETPVAESPAFSRGRMRDAEGAAAGMRALGEFDEAHQLRRSRATSLEGAARDIDPAIRVQTIGTGRPGVARSYEVTMPDEVNTAKVHETTDGKVFVDASDMSQGADGSSLYQAVGDYAHNTGKVFAGDPAGLSGIGLRRRTEQMAASALRWGTAEHLEPHPRQLVGDPREGVEPLRWGGDDQRNIENLLHTAYRNVAARVPELAHIHYNFRHRRFEWEPQDESADRGNGGGSRPASAPENARGVEVVWPEFGRLAHTAGARAARAGGTTLARAAYYASLVREGRRQGWPGLLAALAQQQGDDGLAPALHEILYSRDGGAAHGTRLPPDSSKASSGADTRAPILAHGDSDEQFRLAGSDEESPDFIQGKVWTGTGGVLQEGGGQRQVGPVLHGSDAGGEQQSADRLGRVPEAVVRGSRLGEAHSFISRTFESPLGSGPARLDDLKNNTDPREAIPKAGHEGVEAGRRRESSLNLPPARPRTGDRSLAVGVGGEALGRFADLPGAYDGPLQAYKDAAALTGLHLGIDVLPGPDDMPSATAMRYLLGRRCVEVNQRFKMDRSQAAQFMTEELLHAVDHLGGMRTISGGSSRLALHGDIRREVERHVQGRGRFSGPLLYPLAEQGFSDGRMRAELFARLGTLYFADPDGVRSLLPLTHGAFDGSFRLVRSDQESPDFIQGKVWTGTRWDVQDSSGQGGGHGVLPGSEGSGGQQHPDRLGQLPARAMGQGFRLGDLRNSISRAFESPLGGGRVRLNDLESKSAPHGAVLKTDHDGVEAEWRRSADGPPGAVSKAVDPRAPTSGARSFQGADAAGAGGKPRPAGGMAPEAVQGLVDRISSQWRNGPKIHVLRSMEEAPEAARAADRQQRSQGAGGQPRGFFHQGEAYLVADALRGPFEAAQTLFHEALGHYGLRGVFGDRLKPVLRQVAAARVKDVAAKMHEYGFDPASDEHRLRAAEELLAEMAERYPDLPAGQHSMVRRAVDAVRDTLRAMGVPLHMSDEEIARRFLVPAREWVRSGVRAPVEGASAFSRSGDRPDDPILLNGKPDLWNLPGEIAERTRGRFPSAPVRLLNGRHVDKNRGFGVAHIEAEHGHEIRALGLTVPEYVHRILSNASEIYDNGTGRLLVRGDKAPRGPAIIELRRDGDHYHVITAFERKPEGKLVWSGRRVALAQEGSAPLEPRSSTATTRPSTDRSAQNARRDEPAKQVLNPRSDALADQTSSANDTPVLPVLQTRVPGPRTLTLKKKPGAESDGGGEPPVFSRAPDEDELLWSGRTSVTSLPGDESPSVTSQKDFEKSTTTTPPSTDGSAQNARGSLPEKVLNPASEGLADQNSSADYTPASPFDENELVWSGRNRPLAQRVRNPAGEIPATATTRPSTDRSAQNARRDEPAKQVLNPRSDALADQTSGANDTPEPAAGKVPGPDRVAQAANRDGLPIREGDDVGLAAGMSEDGRTSVHDAAMPRWYDDARGRRFDLRESRDYHERVEKALLDAGHTYPEAHRAATEVEHARMRQMGFDPNAVEAFQQPYIDHAAHRARAEGSTTPDVTAEPYIDSGELGMRRDAPADPRFVLDREGKRYDQPVHGKLLDSIETVTGRDGDGGYAVMDPHSGKVLKRGSTFELARMRAERMASNLGRRRLQERLDAEPALSQQQLRERFRNRQAEVRFSRAADTPPGRDRPPPDEQSEMQDNAPPSEGRIVSEGKDQSGITGSTEAATAEARSSTWPIIESWTKELAKNPTAYSVLHEVQLDPADYGKSRKVHKLIANKALDDYLQQSGAPEKHLEALIPDIRESVSPEGRRKTPEGWIWEHASTSTTSGRKGVMRLVPDYQHTPKSSWWRTLHPDKGARGGYSEWAIPSGAPPNKSKKK